MQKSLLECALEAPTTHQLGYARHEAAGRGSGSKTGLRLNAQLIEQTYPTGVKIASERIP